MTETLRWQVGDVRVTRVQELQAPDISFVIPDVTAESIAGIDWIGPFRARNGDPLASVHTLVIEAGERRILVDTCIGNDKRLPIPAWSGLQTGFLADLAEAGFPPERIDTVLCTHLHIDHVGWNTRLEGERWVPTFANARTLLARPEWEHWAADENEWNQQILADSVRPLFDADLVDLVETDCAVDDAVRLVPTPGHTPGHVSVAISSRGEEAIITGDLVHHPAQFAHPEWGAVVDTDPEQADRTRRAFMARHADTPTLVIGTHFAGPTAGHLVRDGDAYRLEV